MTADDQNYLKCITNEFNIDKNASNRSNFNGGNSSFRDHSHHHHHHRTSRSYHDDEHDIDDEYCLLVQSVSKNGLSHGKLRFKQKKKNFLTITLT